MSSLASLLLGMAMLAVLNDTDHAAPSVTQTIDAILPGHLNVDIFVDATAIGGPATSPLPNIAFDRTRTNFSMLSGAPANHAPYRVGNNSFSGYAQQVIDAAASQYGGMIDCWAFQTPANNAATPPALASTAARPGIDASHVGIEFAVPPNFMGQDTTSSLSQAAAVYSGMVASLLYQKPGVALGDLKAMLRQTAANWSTGYDAANYGYGLFNYPAALALSAGALYLQPPSFLGHFVIGLQNTFNYSIFGYPQSRRLLERIFVMPAGYPWPLKNELTNSDILDADGIEVASNNGAPSGSGSFDVSMFKPGSYEIIPFTCDAHGNFSRVESYSRIAFTV